MKIKHGKELGFYKVWLKPEGELYKIFKRRIITARMIERNQRNGTHRFLDLPRPGHGVEKIEFICKN